MSLILILFCLASANSTAPGGATPELRKEMLKKADDWSVPQPKAGAKVVKIEVYSSRGASTGQMVDYYALGFVEPGDSKRALVGFDYWDLGKEHKVVDVADLDKLSLKDIAATSPFSSPNGVNFGLLTGIQFLRRGNEKLGAALIDRSLGVESGHPLSMFASPAGEPPLLMLARSCLAAAVNDITSPKPDFAKIKQRIERLVTDQPKLTEPAATVLNSLKANVEHKRPPAGSVEQIIDDYFVGGGVSGAMSFDFGEKSAAKRALILQGFKAVPALIAQRNSIRFSNHLMQGFNNFMSYPMTVGQVADEYLQRFANNEFGSDWLHRQQGYTAEDDAVNAWWKEASALGEEAYVKKFAVVAGDGECRISHELLLLAQQRYPAFLPDFYRTVLKTSTQSWPVAEAIMGCKQIFQDQKIKLFQAAIATNSEAHRNQALRLLQQLRPALADATLVTLLNNAPKDANGEYWTDQDAELGGLVSESRDMKVWKALHSYIDRASLGMRMELIARLEPPRDAPAEILQSFQDIYDRYRNDTTVRDVSSSDKFSGPGAGFPHDRIEMRDFIDCHWADWLELNVTSPERGATPAQWKAFRATVERSVSEYDAKRHAAASAKPAAK